MSTIDEIIGLVSELDKSHGSKLQSKLAALGKDYQHSAENFLSRYENFLSTQNLTLQFAVECYLKMVDDVLLETLYFYRTGEYSAKSFSEVNEKVYANPETMKYYMHGLMLSQFLWSHHYKVFEFFGHCMHKIKAENLVNSYLEVGAGHGLYLSEAMNILSSGINYQVVDISPTSIAMCQRFVDSKDVNYHLSDIYAFDDAKTYDVITVGEVLEHLEDPLSMLKKVRRLLSPHGVCFITVPTNAPAIDHIYLFRDSSEIEAMIEAAGLEVVEKACFSSEDGSDVEKFGIKMPMIYASTLRIANAEPAPLLSYS